MNLDKIREEFPMLKYWIFLDAGGMMIPGKYWLKAAHEFFDLQEKGRMDSGDVATHPFLSGRAMHAKEEAAKLIHAGKEEVTNMYRVMTASNLVINVIINWEGGGQRCFHRFGVSLDFFHIEEYKQEQRSGALVLDDVFQAVGAIDVDVKRDGVDILLNGSYKWQCGLEGAGIFYIKKRLIDEFECLFRNYLTAQFPGGIPHFPCQATTTYPVGIIR